MVSNPLIDRYYSPLGSKEDYDSSDVADAKKDAIENVKSKIARATDEAEKRILLGTLRKLTRGVQ